MGADVWRIFPLIPSRPHFLRGRIEGLPAKTHRFRRKRTDNHEIGGCAHQIEIRERHFGPASHDDIARIRLLLRKHMPDFVCERRRLAADDKQINVQPARPPVGRCLRHVEDQGTLIDGLHLDDREKPARAHAILL